MECFLTPFYASALDPRPPVSSDIEKFPLLAT